MSDPVTDPVVDQSPDEEPFDVERAKTKIAKANSEARALRERLRELEGKAARLDEIEAANKSELEKANERAAAAERERQQSQAEALRWRIAAKHGISDEDAELFLTGIDADTLTKQAERLTERDAERKKNGNRAPNEGKTPSPPGTDPVREFARSLFGAANDS